MSIEERLERLERQNRNLKRAGAAVLVLAASILLMGQAATTKTVEANKFIVKDARGNVRAALATDGDASTLALYDEKANPRVILVAQNLETANKTGATLSVTKEGPILDILDQNGSNRVGVGVFDGVPKLAVGDADQKNMAELLNTADGPMLRMSDGNQKLRVNLSVSPTVGAALGLTDRNERMRAMMGATGPTNSKIERGFVGLYDKDGKVIWKAP